MINSHTQPPGISATRIGPFADKPAPTGTALTAGFCPGSCSCRGIKISKSCAVPVEQRLLAEAGLAG